MKQLYKEKLTQLKEAWKSDPHCYWCGCLLKLSSGSRDTKFNADLLRPTKEWVPSCSWCKELRTTCVGLYSICPPRGINEYKELKERTKKEAQKRQKLRRGLGGWDRARLRDKVIIRDGPNLVCNYCSMVLQTEDPLARNYLTIDHIVPISKGGSPKKLSNVVCSCKTCNKQKGNKLDAKKTEQAG